MATKQNDRLATGFHGPRLAVHKPIGFIALVTRSLFRYFITGRELTGAGDNASFLHDATVDYRKQPVEKLTHARWQRLARRWVIAGIPGLLYLFLNHIFFWTYVGLLAVAGIAWGGYLAREWHANRDVRKNFIYPAGRVLSKTIGVKMGRNDILRCITVPDNFGVAPDKIDDGEVIEGEVIEVEQKPIRIHLPDIPVDEGVKKRIVTQVGARLGVPDAQAKWVEKGARLYVDLLPRSVPPTTVTFDELKVHMLAAGLDNPVCGLAENKRVIHMDFKNDSPHSLGSAGSGAGKSTFYKLIAIQRMRNGAAAIFLDFKKWSHMRWAGRLPEGMVLLEDKVPQIHDVLCKILEELLWRKDFNLNQEHILNKLRRIDVYIEEVNTLMPMLAEYWKMEVAKRKQAARRAVRIAKASEDEVALEEAEDELAAVMGLPSLSPAIQALRYGVNLGREFGIHFHVIGQSISANAIGGRDTRTSFKTRFLARWDKKDWKMLAEGVPFQMCPGGTVGIWAHVHGAQVDIMRVPFVTDADAVAYVLEGHTGHVPIFTEDRVAILSSGDSLNAQHVLTSSPAGQDHVPVSTVSRPALPPVSTLVDLVRLLPTKADGDQMTIKALRSAAGRPGFPEPLPESRESGKAYLYRSDEVLAWYLDREGLPAEIEV